MLDTIRVRFYFTSDTIKDNKDGWMIDNIKVSGYRYFGIEDKEDQVISVNPNPAKHYCRIHVEQSNVRTYEVRLFTLNGALVKQKTFSKNQGKLNLRNLENGVYMLRVQSGVDSWYKKLIKIE